MPVIRIARFILALAMMCLGGPVLAGPPFLTDDPEPTETGHWEIYGPFVDFDGRGASVSGAAGAEINYGAAPDLQLTVGLPIAFEHDPAGTKWGAGDLELSAKYRIVNDERHHLQVALFPGISLPTARNGMGAGKVTALLPVWIQKDAGKWSVFGGGGYAINPGAGNRNYWTGGVALSRQVSEALLVGVEIDRQGAAAVGEGATTSLGLGAIYRLSGRFRLLASGGPVFEDGVSGAGYHGFLALGIDY
ncbi:MAG: transporter [Novosphingobium sp.]